jgi:glycosyltransferase involved in cell wall biosynthesis
MSSPNGSRPLPLLWLGPLIEPSGYADEARTFLLALEREGYEVAARDLRDGRIDPGMPPGQRRAVDRATRRPAPAGEGVHVYHIIPASMQPLNGEGPTVARTMFETDGLPYQWKERLIAVDEVWVPCDFNVDTFERGGLPRDRLHVLPETIDFDVFAPGAEPLRLHGLRGFSFLANFDFTDRKGWDLLLDAWAEAFDPDEDVCLVLKCLGLNGVEPGAIRERIDGYLNGRRTAPLVFSTEVLDVQSLARLYAACDAFVLATRGEGWGRPYMEAMAMGLPTIGSRWSGNLMFMHDGNSWLVDGTVVDVPESAQRHTVYYHGHRWFDPDRDALVAAMREVFRGGEAVRTRAAGARDELVARFGPAPTAARIAELTEGALERWRQRRSRPVACVWRGDGGSGHSLAVVNDGVIAALEAAGDVVVTRISPEGAPDALDVPGVAQQWPPRFAAPSSGPFVLYQPWEFGRVPSSWVDEIRCRVDEVWTPSASARQAFVDSGVAPELVHVVPNGVDLTRFAPDGPRRPLPTTKGTVFLFVGGLIHRKGVDVLLEAFGRAFTAGDDVALVFKAMGGRTFYRGSTQADLVEAFRARPGAPEVVLIEDEVPFGEIPAVYRAADVVVQAYRAEGFCLPALEALACGVPVVVTAGGPTDDFVSDACGWRVPSRRVPLPPGALPGTLELAGEGFVLEPDVAALAAALRGAADPAARAAKAERAREHAERFGWAAAAAAARQRLAALRGRTPVRRIAPAVVEGRRRLLLAALPDWRRSETWVPAVLAYAEAFTPDADTTLVLPAADDAGAFALVTRELGAAGVELDTLADIVLADPADLEPEALELAADAVICTNGRRPARAARVVPPEPAALRELLTV